MEYSEKHEKTKKIVSSFLKLYENTEISHISITQLCQEADINRSTFYSYYLDVYDLEEEIEDYVIDTARNHIDAIIDNAKAQSLDNIFMHIFQYIQADDSLLALMIRSGSESFRKKLIGSIIDELKEKTEKITTEDEDFINLCLRYHFAAVSEVLSKWTHDGKKKDFQIVLNQLFEIANNGVLTVIHEYYLSPKNK